MIEDLNSRTCSLREGIHSECMEQLLALLLASLALADASPFWVLRLWLLVQRRLLGFLCGLWVQH